MLLELVLIEQGNYHQNIQFGVKPTFFKRLKICRETTERFERHFWQISFFFFEEESWNNKSAMKMKYFICALIVINCQVVHGILGNKEGKSSFLGLTTRSKLRLSIDIWAILLRTEQRKQTKKKSWKQRRFVLSFQKNPQALRNDNTHLRVWKPYITLFLMISGFQFVTWFTWKLNWFAFFIITISKNLYFHNFFTTLKIWFWFSQKTNDHQNLSINQTQQHSPKIFQIN